MHGSMLATSLLVAISLLATCATLVAARPGDIEFAPTPTAPAHAYVAVRARQVCERDSGGDLFARNVKLCRLGATVYGGSTMAKSTVVSTRRNYWPVEAADAVWQRWLGNPPAPPSDASIAWPMTQTRGQAGPSSALRWCEQTCASWTSASKGRIQFNGAADVAECSRGCEFADQIYQVSFFISSFSPLMSTHGCFLSSFSAFMNVKSRFIVLQRTHASTCVSLLACPVPPYCVTLQLKCFMRVFVCPSRGGPNHALLCYNALTFPLNFTCMSVPSEQADLSFHLKRVGGKRGGYHSWPDATGR
jgi:hypothetical protein